MLSAVDRVGPQTDPRDTLSSREQRDMFDRLMELFRVAQRANVNV